MSEVSRSERSIRARQTVRIVVWVVVAAAVVVFALLNTQSVSVDVLVAESSTSLWIVIAVCAAAGFVVGYLTRARRD
jgi:uncharacterized integral membrane protein